MTTIIKENAPTPVAATAKDKDATGFQTVEYLIYFFFGVLEILLLFRLILRVAGANTGSAFVGFIYSVTGIFIAPFEGIFRRGTTQGVETTAVFEPSTIIAIIVFAVVAWGIVKLVQIFSGKMQTRN